MRLSSALAASVLAVAAVLTPVAVAGPAGAATCSDVDVAFARGTGEPAGTGIVGRPFVQRVTADLPGRTVSSYAVDYPATFDQNAAPGATDLSRHVRTLAAQCPGTRFVIGGYSQGATVVDQAVGIRTGFRNGEAIPAELAGRVVAVVVYGNPLNASGRTIAGESPAYGPKTKEYCNSQDTVCGGRGSTSGTHFSYPTNGTVDDGARFAAGRIG